MYTGFGGSMKRLWAVLILISALACSIYAQERDEKDVMIQTGVMWTMPQVGMADNFEQDPVGIHVLFGGKVPGLPLFLGMDLSLMSHGTQEQLELYRIDDFPAQAAISSIRHIINMAHLVARWQAETGPVQPFLDLLAGMKFFSTRSTIESDVIIFDEGLQASSGFTDRALSYGVGAGFNLPLYTGKFGVERRPGTASLNISVRYLLGTDADIAEQSFFDEEAGVFRFETRRTPTDLLIPHFGFRFDL
jgi:hypothetical protein